jgi:hypothetical protein
MHGKIKKDDKVCLQWNKKERWGKNRLCCWLNLSRKTSAASYDSPRFEPEASRIQVCSSEAPAVTWICEGFSFVRNKGKNSGFIPGSGIKYFILRGSKNIWSQLLAIVSKTEPPVLVVETNCRDLPPGHVCWCYGILLERVDSIVTAHIALPSETAFCLTGTIRNILKNAGMNAIRLRWHEHSTPWSVVDLGTGLHIVDSIS